MKDLQEQRNAHPFVDNIRFASTLYKEGEMRCFGGLIRLPG